MRKLQGDVARSDLFAIYIRLGTMKRIWKNDAKQRGLPIRRRDEQHLIRPYVDKVLDWEQRQEDMKASGLPACSTGREQSRLSLRMPLKYCVSEKLAMVNALEEVLKSDDLFTCPVWAKVEPKRCGHVKDTKTMSKGSPEC
jgi:hypothetical protein